jgi:tetratricopeptide (TPR) repeat protein
MRVQRWSRRRWVFAVLTVAAMGAVPGALAAAGIKDTWWTGLAVGVAAVVAFFAKPLTERMQQISKRRDDNDLAVLNGCLVTARGELPTVRQIQDPRHLGVHPAARLSDHDAADPVTETAPAYVPRDVDETVRRRIARGGFVLLIGDSTAGKSRTAYEAIAATVPDHVLIAPTNAAAVPVAVDRALQASNCVMWLNDLEHYLGTGGITSEMLTRLRTGKGHRVVVATIRAVEYDRFTDTSGDDSARQTFRPARAVLESADEEVRLQRRLSTAERASAEDRVWDPRIADALRRSGDYGLAEYLAAGPELVRAWRNGWEPGTHPRGAALVQAAVDVRRAGLVPPLPGRLLEELTDTYLQRDGGDRLRPETMGAAWEWALHPRRATTALMTGSAKAGYDVFDYLVDLTQRETTPDTFVPASVLRAAVGYADGATAQTIGWTARDQGYYEVAALAWSVAVQRHSADNGSEHPDTLNSRSNLAGVLQNLGRFEEAEREHRAALEARIRVLGPEHPGTLNSRNNLGLVLQDLGRFQEAEREHRAALEARIRVLGPEHPHALTSRNNLGLVLRALGRFEEAEREHRAALEARMRLLGPEHLRTLNSRNNLGLVLRALGRFEEAEREHRAALEARMRLLGPEHPHTLNSRDNHAVALRVLGRFEEAEREHRAALKARIRVLGPEHPHALTSRDNHAVVLRALGRFEEAEREHRAALKARIRVLGPEHPGTLNSRDNHAVALRVLGRFEEAEREHRAVLEARIRLLGPEHPRTLTTRDNLGLVLQDLGRFEEAEREHRAVLEARIRLLGPEHPRTLNSRDNLTKVRSLRDKSES